MGKDDGGFAILTRPSDNFPELCRKVVLEGTLQEIEQFFGLESEKMTYITVGTCPHCGAPIYTPVVDEDVTAKSLAPPPSYHSCDCRVKLFQMRKAQKEGCVGLEAYHVGDQCPLCDKPEESEES